MTQDRRTKLLFRILILLGEPGQQARRSQYERAQQLLFLESFVADDIDLANLGGSCLHPLGN